MACGETLRGIWINGAEQGDKYGNMIDKKLLGAKGIATRNKKLLGAPGRTARNKDATRNYDYMIDILIVISSQIMALIEETS